MSIDQMGAETPPTRLYANASPPPSPRPTAIIVIAFHLFVIFFHIFIHPFIGYLGFFVAAVVSSPPSATATVPNPPLKIRTLKQEEPERKTRDSSGNKLVSAKAHQTS